MDLRILLLLCITLCEVLCNEYFGAEVSTDENNQEQRYLKLKRRVTCPDLRDYTDIRMDKDWTFGSLGNRNYYEGDWPVGSYLSLKCYHRARSTFLTLPYGIELRCKDTGEWKKEGFFGQDKYQEFGYCGHCANISHRHSEVINYTSPFQVYHYALQFSQERVWSVRTTAFIRCHDGYSGPSERTCNFDGSWSKTDCKQIVCEALSLPHGYISYNESSIEGGYPIDTEVFFSCRYGYYLIGPKTRICQPAGTWSLKISTCKKVTCQVLSLPNGLINYNKLFVNGGFPVDTEAFFSCKCGYSQSGPSSRICELSGTWSLTTTTCDQISCEALSLTSGEISYDRSPVNERYLTETIAYFSCNDGYSQFGPSSRNCRTSGAWNSQNTTCEISCKALEKIAFGHIAYTKSPSIVDGTYPQNTIANFSCNDGFSKTGPEIRTCQASGKWDKGNQWCRIAKP